MMIGKKGEAKSSISTADAASITVRGKDLCRDLIGTMSFSEFFFFHLTGRAPSADQAFFLDALLVTIAEHGLTPSVQAARATLAAGPEAMQGAVAAGILGCGSVVLGTAEYCADLLEKGVARVKAGEDPAQAAVAMAREVREAGGKLPGFGHPIHHPVDPRTVRLLELADARKIAGPHVAFLRVLAPAVRDVWGKALTMNVSGPIAAILLDLGFPKAAVKGIPLLARTAGIIGHLVEETRRPIGFLMAHHAEEAISYDPK
jgi:citrate synthase